MDHEVDSRTKILDLLKVVLLACLGLGCTSALADISISEQVSPVCATAQSELARVKDLPVNFISMTKGDLSLVTVDHYQRLLRSSDCSCAAVESLFPRGDVRSSVLAPDLEPISVLARLVLEMPQCRAPPDLVLSAADCLSNEIQATLESGLGSALRRVTDPRVKTLLQDAVVRGQCFTIDGRRVYRAGVWRHGYGNPATLADAPGSGNLPAENIALHVTGVGLQQLLVEIAPQVQSLLQDHMLNLVTDDANSLHLNMNGQAVVGDGEAQVTIHVDARILRFETKMFEMGVSLTDAVHIETAQQHDDRIAAMRAGSPRVDIPIDSPPVRCASSANVDRGVDVVRVFAALFLVPLFGPGISGGIDWFTSRTLNDELQGAGISGAICGLVDNLPVRTPISGTAVVTVDFSRALADDSGFHLFGTLGLAPKAPAVWITKPLALFALPFLPALPAKRFDGVWLIANSRDLLNPKFSWSVVSGWQVADTDATGTCGPSPGANAICVIEPGDRPCWVTVTGSEAGTSNMDQGTYFHDATGVVYCSGALGCTSFIK